MADIPQVPQGHPLQRVPKWVLYTVLMLATIVPLLLPNLSVPNKPKDEAIDFYASVMALPEGSTVLIGSDWTNSTRGESGGEFEALLRILMRKNIKFAFYSTADPRAPQVARNVIQSINEERKTKGQRPWVRWADWVSIGYFPNSEAATNNIGADIRKAFAGKKDVTPEGQATDVFQSPVLKNIRSVSDFPILILVTASKTSDITIERIYGKVPLAFMVTGVMGPESLVYYSSKQLVGLCVGLKGVYDIETMMENGINLPDKEHSVVRSDRVPGPVANFPGEINKGKGTAYYPTLHFALALLILAVVVGNIGMFLSKKRAA